MKCEFVLTADYCQTAEMSFISKIYLKEVGRDGVLEYLSLSDLFRNIKSARITVYALKFFARFLFDYLEKNGKTFNRDYTALITDTGDVFFINIGALSFVSFSKRTCLGEDFESLNINADVDIPELIKSNIKTLLYMNKALETAFSMGITKSVFSTNIRRDFCAGDARRRAYLFPQLSSYEFETCANSYKGGRAYVNTDIHGDAIREEVQELDIVSAYPFYMKDAPLPYGAPVRYEGRYTADPRRPFYIQKLRAEIHAKPGTIPSLLLKDHPIWNQTRYISDTDVFCVTFCVTSVELENLVRYYDFGRVEYLGGYKFRAATGLFDEYLSKWYPLKAAAPRGTLERHYAKRMLDNLGGMLGTRDRFVNLQPKLAENKVILEKTAPSSNHSVYCPAIAFTTAYLRNTVNDIIQQTEVLYTATDSFHIRKADTYTSEIIKSVFPEGEDMGCVSVAGNYDYARYLNPNFYLAHLSGTDKMKVVAAGVPRKYNQTLANLKPGDKIEVPGFISIQSHPGGALLKRTSQIYKF